MKVIINAEISARLDELFEISRYLYENPETGEEEFLAEKIVTDYLEKNGFAVEHGVFGIATAFRATYDSGKNGPSVAFLCEYDALPKIGHACGHNLIASMSLGAATGLKSVLDSIGGKIIVLGTPAEETSGVKVLMAEKGAFKDVSFAMMAHPNSVSEESGTSLALNTLQFEYHGKAAHAAAAPEKGINALDAVILLFNGINALRQHVSSDVRIHGIITSGGMAPNIVPDYAEAKFYVRGAEMDNLEQVTLKVMDCALGAEKMTGAKVKIIRFENSYDTMRTNRFLSDLFTANLSSLGETEIHPPGNAVGSLDMGNVSHVVPAIHPWIGMGDPSLLIHSKEFADCTMTEMGKSALLKGACALALTAYDVIISEENQLKIQNEFLSK